MRQMRHRLAFQWSARWAHRCGAVVRDCAAADQVTSKGTVLHGKITAVSQLHRHASSRSTARDRSTIKWEDIEDLKTDGNFQLLYGDGEETDTPLQGYSNKTLYTGSSPDGATPVDVATIHSGVAIGPDGPGWRDKLRSTFRYWDGELDFAFNAQQSTIDIERPRRRLQDDAQEGPDPPHFRRHVSLRDAEGPDNQTRPNRPPRTRSTA